MRKASVLLRCLALPALLLGAFSAFGQDTPMTKIVIQVKTQSGRPIDRAEVVVTFLEARTVHNTLAKLGRNLRTSYDLRSNQEGEAKIPTIPQGKIKILVNAKGYQTYGDVLEIYEEQKTVEVKLNPPQPQYSAH
jgi:preprotein translocase subunit SecD